MRDRAHRSPIPVAGTFVVYDLEFTSWPGSLERDWSGDDEHREVVQIGAVCLDIDDDWRETAAFEALVRPVANPRLSDYFTALTGIDDAMLAADGLDAATALARFAAFVGPRAPLLSNGDDAGAIAETCALNGLADPFAGRYVDLSAALAAALGKRDVMTSDLPALLGLAPSGRAHDALADARALAAALAQLRTNGRL